MTGANDSSEKRRIRNGYLKYWANADFSEIASYEVLRRLAEARNLSSNSANKFMLFSAAGAFLYFLRLEGVADELAIGAYNLNNLPFGLFILSSISTILSTISLIRTGDSRAYDRQLRLVCEKSYDSNCHFRYAVFPNVRAWGEPFSRMLSVIDAGWTMSKVRFASLILINFFLFAILVGPIISGVDYLFCSDRD